MNKFKVGDKVKRIQGDNDEFRQGEVGTIIGIESGYTIKTIYGKISHNNDEAYIQLVPYMGKHKKLTHLIIYDEQDRDPIIECYGISQVREEVERLHKEDNVIKESIKIYEIKSIIEPVIKVGLKKVS